MYHRILKIEDRTPVLPCGACLFTSCGCATPKAEYRAVIASAHDQLSREVREFAKVTGKVCDKCGKPMVHRVKKPGKDGKGGYNFWGCSGWPECNGKN